MLHNVALKTLRDQRRGLIGWSLGLVVLVGLYAAMFPSMRGNTSYTDLVNALPESLRALFVAAGGDVSSGPGYLYVELLSFMAPLLVLVYGIGAGAGAIAGEEDRGTLDLLLAGPVRRGSVLLQKYAAALAGLVALMAVLWAATVSLGALADMGLSAANVAATVLHLGLLGAEFTALALLTGAATGRLALSRAVPALVAVVAYLVNGFAPTVSWLAPVRKLSPFYQYLGADPIRHGVSLAAIGVSAATSAVLVGLAVAALRRRDLA